VSADVLLARLDGVRRTGVDRGTAKCPAHEDKRASLSWRELPDGRVLLHCFAQCSTEAVLVAVGLGLDALFPEKPIAGDFGKRERRPWSIDQGLDVLDYETNLICVAALNIGNGARLKPEDCERVLVARERIMHVVGVLRGG
jgi:hypothetical protein